MILISILILGIIFSLFQGIMYILNYKRLSIDIYRIITANGMTLSCAILILFNLPLWILIVFLPLFLFKKKIKINENKSLAFIILLLPFISSFIFSLDALIMSNSLQPALGTLNPIWNLISYFVSVTGSQWMLIFFGSFFTPLVIHKIVYSRKNRIRLSLMLLAYWIYSTYLPNFSPVASIFPLIPYSWFNGLGTYAPVEPSLLLGIVGTYVVTAVLSLFFGSRQICSVTCTAPFMLQGSVMMDTRVFNRTSKLGRKMLTSRLNIIYKITSSIIWVMLLTFGIISYLNQIGYTNFYILGNDPTMLYVAFYFNLIWYIQFLLIPFLGNYSCVNMGLCTWGTFNQLFGRLGFFKLKVKDPLTCINCKTVDCATACPVGITDMRASFIKKGEFRALKCIGTGECIEACPHDNIFIYDFRNWVRGKLNK
jgi:polyferredoxin